MNLPTQLTGAGLIYIGMRAYKDEGFPWPEAWERRLAPPSGSPPEAGRWVPATTECPLSNDEYRIKPSLLEPPAPRVIRLVNTGWSDPKTGKSIWQSYENGGIPFVERTDQVRTRLGETAGVDRQAFEFYLSPYMSEPACIDTADKIMQLIADGRVEV